MKRLRPGVRFLFLLVCALLGPGTALAHDLGVARAELREIEPGRYLLTARVPGRMAAAYGPPELPARFTVTPASGAATGGGGLRYEFSCVEEPLAAGDVMRLPWRREGVVLVTAWLDGEKTTSFFPKSDGGIEVRFDQLQVGSGSLASAARRYTVLGVGHILLGIDHLLFVLGLLFIVRGAWRLAQTITAFTVAHSLTLALATLGLVQVPSRAVDAIVALSIVFLGAEILRARQGQAGLTVRYPWIVAFGFGLIHGLGFAGALSALGLPKSEIPVALLFFNVGVEIGQLMFVLVFLSVRGSLRRLEVTFPRWAESIPAYGIGIVAMYWFFGRLLVLFQPTML